MELGSHCELDCPLLQVSTAGCPDSVFVTLWLSVTLRRTVTERNRRLIRDGSPGRPPPDFP